MIFNWFLKLDPPCCSLPRIAKKYPNLLRAGYNPKSRFTWVDSKLHPNWPALQAALNFSHSSSAFLTRVGISCTWAYMCSHKGLLHWTEQNLSCINLESFVLKHDFKLFEWRHSLEPCLRPMPFAGSLWLPSTVPWTPQAQHVQHLGNLWTLDGHHGKQDYYIREVITQKCIEMQWNQTMKRCNVIWLVEVDSGMGIN